MKKNTVKGYICGTDIADVWFGANDVKIFSSVKALKKARKCWKNCGIVELELKPKYIVKGIL